MWVAADASKEIPHLEESTRVDAHPPIALRSDGRPQPIISEGVPRSNIQDALGFAALQ